MKGSFAVILAAGALFAFAAPGRAQNSGTPRPGSVNPNLGGGPAVQKSLPSTAPDATTTRRTGATDQGPAVKSMNHEENAKVEAKGK